MDNDYNDIMNYEDYLRTSDERNAYFYKKATSGSDYLLDVNATHNLSQVVYVAGEGYKTIIKRSGTVIPIVLESHIKTFEEYITPVEDIKEGMADTIQNLKMADSRFSEKIKTAKENISKSQTNQTILKEKSDIEDDGAKKKLLSMQIEVEKMKQKQLQLQIMELEISQDANFKKIAIAKTKMGMRKG